MSTLIAKGLDVKRRRLASVADPIDVFTVGTDVTPNDGLHFTGHL
jgi:hypothetical protein